MSSRGDCDAMYQSIGYPKFDPAISYHDVQARLTHKKYQHISISDQHMILRCATMASSLDMDEYFDISEYATSDAAKTMLSNPSLIWGVYLLRYGSNDQHPLELWLIPVSGYCFRKYMSDPSYQVLPLTEFRQDVQTCITGQISNLPGDIIDRIFTTGRGIIIFPAKFYGMPSCWVTEALALLDNVIIQPLYKCLHY